MNDIDYYDMARKILGKFGLSYQKAKLMNDDDAISEIVLSLYQADTSYDSKRGSLGNWRIYRARNKIMNITRKRKRTVEYVSSPGLLDEVKNKSVLSYFINQKKASQYEAINRLLCSVSPLDKQVVELYYFKNKTYLEIAKILKLSGEGVRKRMNRVLLDMKINAEDLEIEFQ